MGWPLNTLEPFDFFPISDTESEKVKRGRKRRKRENNEKGVSTQGDKKEKKNGGSKANLYRSLQNYGDLKWRFTGKSSKFDLPINKSTYKYINLSYLVDYVLKKNTIEEQPW